MKGVIKTPFTLTMEQLIKEIEAVRSQLFALQSQLYAYDDGYLYLTCLRSYGSLTWKTHTNEYTVQELCDQYDGQHGLVDVYTTNPNTTVTTEGYLKKMTLDEIKNVSQDDISMSEAISNWIAKSM